MVEEFWMERVCRKCGKEISLRYSDVRDNCDLEGNLKIRCPSCNEGEITYHIDLTKAEVTMKALKS